MTLTTRSLTAAVLFAAAAAQAQAATVAQVFNGDMLDTNQRYFESIAGVPRESLGDDHIFRVQGCNITASIHGGKVSALRLELGPKCNADLSSFIDTFAPPAGAPLTVGNFQQAAGDLSFYSSCITMCGNAADPSVYALWEGPHAIGFREVLLEVVLVDDGAIEASNQWQTKMVAAKGDDFVNETRFNCERTFDAPAQQAFAKVRVDAVTIGTQLTKPGC